MARFCIAWLAFIALATAGSYAATAAAFQGAAVPAPAMRALASRGLSSAACTQATRALVAAASGSRPGSTPEERTRYEGARAAVVEACSED